MASKNKGHKKKTPAKGAPGIMLQKVVLKLRYVVEIDPKNSAYDLPALLNTVTGKNVSIKCTKGFTLCCTSIFNFLGSKNLELVAIQYLLNTGVPFIYKSYIFNDLDIFFRGLNPSINPFLLDELQVFLKNLKYPFSDADRAICKEMAKSVVTRNYCNFKVACKLSRGNKRIQCTIALDQLCGLFPFTTVI
jgi:hypothetical protein